jgi:hypothetical protein
MVDHLQAHRHAAQRDRGHRQQAGEEIGTPLEQLRRASWISRDAGMLMRSFWVATYSTDA